MQAGIKIARRNIDNLSYAGHTTLMAENKEELKSFLMKVKESEKAFLKLSIQKLRSWHPVPLLHGKQIGKNGISERLFYWSPKSLQMVTGAMKIKDSFSLEEKL